MYRRSKSSDTWHWCKNCSKFPKENYIEQAKKPTTGEQCNECRVKELRGQCRK